MTDDEFLEYCRKTFRYDPKTGILWRLFKTMSKQVNALDGHGYYHVRILHKPYKVHRIAWLITYGYFPEFIDHENRIKTDNRLSNLRECSRQENNQNISIRIDNTSKYKGVYYNKRLNKWQAYIQGQYIGVFISREEAAKAYNVAAIERYGEFAALNAINE